MLCSLGALVSRLWEERGMRLMASRRYADADRNVRSSLPLSFYVSDNQLRSFNGAVILAIFVRPTAAPAHLSLTAFVSTGRRFYRTPDLGCASTLSPFEANAITP